MAILTRRSVLRGSVGLAAGALARPHLANAAATTAEVWWTQGFAQEEDVAFKKLIADYEKESGNKIEDSIVPFAPMRQKMVSAITAGVVPDCPASAPVRQKGRVEEGSDCLIGQAGSGCHGRWSRRIALRIVISLRATATSARTLDFPAATSLSRNFLSCGL